MGRPFRETRREVKEQDHPVKGRGKRQDKTQQAEGKAELGRTWAAPLH